MLEAYQDRLGSVASLPSSAHGYAQAPYAALSEDSHRPIVSGLRPLREAPGHEPSHELAFYDGGAELP